MPSFRSAALACAEAFLGYSPQDLPRFTALTEAFEQAFLHYTERHPGHWTCPGWDDFPDMPSVGACVILAFLAARSAGMNTPRSDSLIQPYHEFLGAMMNVCSPEEAFFASLCADAAAREFPGEKHYALLAEAFRRKSVDPGTSDSRRAAEIGRCLADGGQKCGFGFPV